jgi:hypothetical protein
LTDERLTASAVNDDALFEARQVLSVAYGRFTEGFETMELKAAKRLLAEL